MKSHLLLRLWMWYIVVVVYIYIYFFNKCFLFFPTVQFDGLEKSRMSPTKDGKVRPLQRHSSSCLVNTKMTSLDQSSSSVGERIDPSMPLENQLWVRCWCRISSVSLSSMFLSPLTPGVPHAVSLSVSLLVGTMEPSVGPTRSLCSGCVKRPVTWWETVRPARTTTPSPSSKDWKRI